MGGDDRVRFCDHCRKNVYTISALTSAEATALLEAKQGNLCARIYQRTDGTVLTEDCPVGVARQWRRLKMLVSGGVAVILLTLVNVSAFGRDGDKIPTNNRPRSRSITATEDTLSRLAERLGLCPARRTMGMVAFPVGKIAPPNTPTPPPAKK